MRVLLSIPNQDFDPTEAAVPWKILTENGVEVIVATPQGGIAAADSVTLTGKGLGLLRMVLQADARGRAAYDEFASAVCNDTQAYSTLQSNDFDALILPGGHAPKMRSYLESTVLHRLIAEFFAQDKIVAAVCHGVVAAARAKNSDGHSVLRNRRSTARTERMELFAWKRTRKRLGNHYRTYPEITVQQEVCQALGPNGEFLEGPPPLLRDTPDKPNRGFIVEDGNYLSARYPGDIHRLSYALLNRLQRAM